MKIQHTIPSEPSPFRYEPRDMQEAMAFAQAVVDSGLIPNLRSAEKAFVLIATGAELGMTAMQSLRSIYVIDGKPTLSADLLVALVKRSTECEWFRLVASDAERAVYETQRRGDPEPVRHVYTIEDGRRAGLTGRRPWREHPAAMLRARCASALARMVYPDMTTGLFEGESSHPYAALMRERAPQTVTSLNRASAAVAETGRRRAQRRRSEASESPEQTLERARRARAQALTGMGTSDAARHVARQLVERGLHGSMKDAMQGLVAAVQAQGVVPAMAEVEHLLEGWLELDPPTRSRAAGHRAAA